MGAWGVKATECDYGLDMLDGDVIRYLQKSDFRFNVKEIKDILKRSIEDEIRYANRGCPEKLMEHFIQENYPYRYDIAVLLIAECLTDYFSSGELILDIYERDNTPYQRQVSEFIYTGNDLKSLLDDLKALLDPERDTFQLWKDSQSFFDWKELLRRCVEHLKTFINRDSCLVIIAIHRAAFLLSGLFCPGDVNHRGVF